MQKLNSKQIIGQRRNNRKIRKCLETNDTECITYQNLWDVEKAVLSRKFISVNIYPH